MQSNICDLFDLVKQFCIGIDLDRPFYCFVSESMPDDCETLLKGSRSINSFPFAVIVFFSFFSTLISSIYQSLTSLSIKELEVVSLQNQQISLQRYAKLVLKCRRLGRWLDFTYLITLVLLNSYVVIQFDNLLEDIEVINIIISSLIIFMTAKLLPTLFINEYHLQIAYFSFPITALLLFLLAPIAFPLGKILDNFYKDVAGGTALDSIKRFIDVKASDSDKNHRVADALNILQFTAADVVHPLEDFYFFKPGEVVSPNKICKIILNGQKSIFMLKELETYEVKLSSLPLINFFEDVNSDELFRSFGKAAVCVEENTPFEQILDKMCEKITSSVLVYRKNVENTDEETNKRESNEILKPQTKKPLDFVGVVNVEDLFKEMNMDNEDIASNINISVKFGKSKIFKKGDSKKNVELSRPEFFKIDQDISFYETELCCDKLLSNKAFSEKIFSSNGVKSLLELKPVLASLKKLISKEKINYVRAKNLPERTFIKEGDELDFCLVVLEGECVILEDEKGEKRSNVDLLGAEFLIGDSAKYKANESIVVVSEHIKIVKLIKSRFDRCFYNN